jgi:hypothetical protein
MASTRAVEQFQPMLAIPSGELLYYPSTSRSEDLKSQQFTLAGLNTQDKSSYVNAVHCSNRFRGSLMTGS